jgi:hypothetical protein
MQQQEELEEGFEGVKLKWPSGRPVKSSEEISGNHFFHFLFVNTNCFISFNYLII